MDAEGSGQLLLIEGDAHDPAWSPDGKQILFASRRGGRSFGLYVADWQGQNIKQLAKGNNPLGLVCPAWSPDGKRIAYAELRNGQNYEVMVCESEGKNAKQLTQLGGMNLYPAWSPDGRQLAFYHHTQNQGGTLYLVDASGANSRVILKGESHIEGGRPVWRPR